MIAERHTIPARAGLGVRVSGGQRYKVLNTHDTQIVDHWAFNGADVVLPVNSGRPSQAHVELL